MGWSHTCWQKTHCRALDAVVLRMVRSLMMGKAANKTGPHDKAMKSWHLWKWIRMVPAELELRVRRLKWLQAISKDVQLNAQLIAAVWGRRVRLTDEAGELEVGRTTFEEMFEADMEEAGRLEGAEEFGGLLGCMQTGGGQRGLSTV